MVKDKIAELMTCELVIPLMNKKGIFFFALSEDLDFEEFSFNKSGFLEGKISGKFFLSTKLGGIGEEEKQIIDKLIHKKKDD